MLRMKCIRPILMALVTLLVTTQVTRAQDEKLKAIFIYNFTRYIEWPQKNSTFVIIILGKSTLAAELQGIAGKKKVGNADIEIKTVTSPEEIAEANIIYITNMKSSALPALLPKSKAKNMLIITERPNSCKDGSSINFVNDGGKLIFELCKNNIAACGLSVSSSLFTLGKVIE